MTSQAYDKAEFKIGDIPIEESNTYKYLGNTINNKETMHDHINAVKGKCEATTQSILSISKHKYLREQDMATIMQLHDACTVDYANTALWIGSMDTNKR